MERDVDAEKKGIKIYSVWKFWPGENRDILKYPNAIRFYSALYNLSDLCVRQ